jgi:hypothetical protein
MLKSILRIGSLFLFAFFLVACNKSNSLNPTEAAPDVYKEVLENNQIRMLVATLPPGEKEPRPHTHPRHAIYVIVGGELTQYPVEGSPTNVPYYNENSGTTTVQWLVVEFKEKETEAE